MQLESSMRLKGNKFVHKFMNVYVKVAALQLNIARSIFPPKNFMMGLT